MELALEPEPATGDPVRPGHEHVQAERVGVIRAALRPWAEDLYTSPFAHNIETCNATAQSGDDLCRQRTGSELDGRLQFSPAPVDQDVLPRDHIGLAGAEE